MDKAASKLALLCLLGLSVHAYAAPDWAGVGSDSEAAWAYAQQTVMPEWSARLQQAERKEAARERYFSDSAPLAECFPDLAGLDLSDVSVVRGRLLLLDEQAEQRARERLAPRAAIWAR